MNVATSSLVEELKAIEALQNVPSEQLEWLIDKGEVLSIEVGEHIFEPEKPALYMLIVLEGNFQVVAVQNGEMRNFTDLEPGNITGVLPYSRLKSGRAFATATIPSRIIRIHKENFPELIKTQYELTEALVHFMTTRVRKFTQFQQQTEKLASLGKLSAGLAHELNNPAAAVVRSSEALRKYLKTSPEKFKKIVNSKVTPDMVDAVNELLFSKLEGGVCTDISMMEKSSMEDELLDWLDDHEVEGADEIAETLVEFGFTEDDLDGFLDAVGEEHLEPVVTWVNNVLSTEKMVSEIQEASNRIGDLVKSIKSYTHMDRSKEKHNVNVHEGLRNTVTMLNHKLRKAQVEVIEDFRDDVPEIMGMAGEFNQIWTNIIDNAIDAMSGRENNRLELHTRSDGGFVRICIIDNGPGIPEDVKNKIFDPFFTTKDLGSGTGLGLDVVARIVRQHKGDIVVNTEPGRTEFRITFSVAG